jgi:hypothetical protein
VNHTDRQRERQPSRQHGSQHVNLPAREITKKRPAAWYRTPPPDALIQISGFGHGSEPDMKVLSSRS